MEGEPPDVAWRSLEGAAFTVSLSDCLPFGGTGKRDSDAAVEGLPVGVLARECGVDETVRVERRVGGMVVVVVVLC
jgi:hypothetical protein